ncbi:hypothetical protein BFR04_05110 [Gaetbulibacter sp. 4G1]|nr:DUF695 domain-containing protein [Gaetbulibacter sp. 4G1]PIA78902.1 hypothetical protein BFR04_05110 [Gaetbulibacter sp. 4G1]
MKNQIFLLFFSIIFSSLYAQKSEENWQVYMAAYDDNKPGSTTVRMDLIDLAPLADYNFVLVTGITYESERDDGFPSEDSTFKLLHKIGDELEVLLKKGGESVLVGSFMYDFERLEYFYLKSDDGIKEKIETFYKINYPSKKYYLNIKEDKKWEYYTEFLYPNEATRNYMSDQSIVEAIQRGGDNLTKSRRVDHWSYFKSKSDIEKFKKEILENNFKIEISNENEDYDLPYGLQFYREDKVDIDSIYPITSFLREISKKYNGKYDGWETFIVKD